MEKAVFQVTVSLSIRKDSVAETLPPSHGNAEGSSNKQLELPGNETSHGLYMCNRMVKG